MRAVVPFSPGSGPRMLGSTPGNPRTNSRASVFGREDAHVPRARKRGGAPPAVRVVFTSKEGAAESARISRWVAEIEEGGVEDAMCARSLGVER